MRSNTYETPFAGHGERLNRFSVDDDVRDDCRRRYVVIPQRVVHELEVPLALSGFQIDQTMLSAKRLLPDDGRHSNRTSASQRQVDQAGLLVDGDLRPHAGVAGPPDSFPRVVAEFTVAESY